MQDSRLSSRRSFLKHSAALVGTVSLTNGLNIARAAHAQGSDQVKIALIGCGGRGTGAAANFLEADPNLRVVALADAFEERVHRSRESLTRLYKDRVDVPVDRMFVGLDAYRSAMQTEADVVILATPPGFRPAHFAAAVEAGKHVFMEKPCCVDAPGYRSLLETNKAADQKRRKVGVGLQNRHRNDYLEAIEQIHGGALGDVVFVRAYWNTFSMWRRPRQPGQSEMQYQVANWYYFVWLSGDHIVEQLVHNLDVCNWVLKGHPVEANGLGGRAVRWGPDTGEIYDHHFVEYTYADGVKLFAQCKQIPCGHATCQRLPATRKYSSRRCSMRVEECVHGTQGVFESPGPPGRPARIEGRRPWVFRGEPNNPFLQESADLLAAIRSDKDYNEGWYGADSSFTAIIGRMATYSGLPVIKWSDAVADGPSEMPQRLAWDAPPPVLPDQNRNYPLRLPGFYYPYVR